MVDERKDVQYPIWRKKVDGSLFQYGLTALPDWVKQGVFDIEDIFTESSKKHPKSQVTIEYVDGGTTTSHQGWVTTTKHGKKWAAKRKPSMRLGFDSKLKAKLQDKFMMSHMRDLERRMRKCKVSEIESEIPFYEFLDIEWDKSSRRFIFTPHYVQAPVFEKVFLICNPNT